MFTNIQRNNTQIVTFLPQRNSHKFISTVTHLWCNNHKFLVSFIISFFFPFDLATRNQISKNLFINDLHTSCFYLPTRTTQDHPLSLGQSTSISILLVRRTNYCGCIRSWLASWIIIKSSSSVQSLGCRYSAL